MLSKQETESDPTKQGKMWMVTEVSPRCCYPNAKIIPNIENSNQASQEAKSQTSKHEHLTSPPPPASPPALPPAQLPAFVPPTYRPHPSSLSPFLHCEAGLSKFAKLARSVTRSRSVLVTQFSSHLPVMKDVAKQSNITHVSVVKLLYSLA